MKRWIGLLGSWALLILGISIGGVAIAAELINFREVERFRRFGQIDSMLEQKHASTIEKLRSETNARERQVGALGTRVQTAQQQMDEHQDTDQTILVSTTENKVYVRSGNEVVFEAIASTGKGTTLVHNGRAMVFNTPIGRFKVRSKEQNPVWVPPDWHYVEEARKRGMRVVQLGYGDSIDVSSGSRVKRGSGVWGWFDGGNDGVLKVKGKDVVVDYGSYEKVLPPGGLITAGGAVVIPPVGTRQRQFEKVLGSFRLNLGDGYALHGTQQTDQLGRSVSHGCVRLADDDIRRLYQMAKVGDEVIIY